MIMGLCFEQSNLTKAVLRGSYQRCLGALDIQEQKFFHFTIGCFYPKRLRYLEALHVQELNSLLLVADRVALKMINSEDLLEVTHIAFFIHIILEQISSRVFAPRHRVSTIIEPANA